MTKNEILDKIHNRIFELPKEESAEYLIGYMNGYAKCQEDIENLIKELIDGNKV